MSLEDNMGIIPVLGALLLQSHGPFLSDISVESDVRWTSGSTVGKVYCRPARRCPTAFICSRSPQARPGAAGTERSTSWAHSLPSYPWSTTGQMLPQAASSMLKPYDKGWIRFEIAKSPGWLFYIMWLMRIRSSIAGRSRRFANGSGLAVDICTLMGMAQRQIARRSQPRKSSSVAIY